MSTGMWTVSFAGVVEQVEREDIDKTGRGQRHNLIFHVRPDQPPALPAGVTVPAVIPARIKDLDLARLTAQAPDQGAAVEVTVRASGPRPATFTLTALRPR